MRKCLEEEFSSIYVFNLRGNARTSGEQRRMEKDNVFGQGTRTPVSICFLVKNPNSKAERATIHYRDIGDYLSQEEKLSIITSAGSMTSEEMSWKVIKPNKEGDWINQRSEAFETMIPLGDKKSKGDKTAFKPIYGRGIQTARDFWCYNCSSTQLKANVKKTIDFYNEQRLALNAARQDDPEVLAKNFVDYDSTKISWTLTLTDVDE